MNWSSKPLIGRPNPLLTTSYSTFFNGAPENPISENGRWYHTLSGGPIVVTTTSPNRATGAQVGGQDSYSYLSGFGSNYSIMAQIYKNPAIDTVSGQHEVELHLRMSDNASNVFSYECNWSSIGAYAQIVRWNGPVGNFTQLGNFGAFTAPVTGDWVRADINGNTITTYINAGGTSGWSQMLQLTDNTYATGQPGIGMWLNDLTQSPASFYGFTFWSAAQIG